MRPLAHALPCPYRRTTHAANRYTSLGSTYNTFPNPELLVLDEGAGEIKSKREEHPYVRAIATCQPSTGDEGRKARHLPAYELKDEDGSLERKGRVKAKQPAAS